MAANDMWPFGSRKDDVAADAQPAAAAAAPRPPAPAPGLLLLALIRRLHDP